AEPPALEPPHPLGYAYVIAGSQMGARLLHRDWSRATDPAVRSAGRYLSANLQGRAWPELMRRLKSMSGAGADADAALATANRVFDAYGLAATQLGIERIQDSGVS
ncbi:MAG: hypothetical protein WBG08_05840, partial [Litorimonas sp.]